MSRTYRRKKLDGKTLFNLHYKGDVVRHEEYGCYVPVQYRKGSKEDRKQRSWFHSDNGPSWSVPADFRYVYRDRKYRAQASAELRRVNKNPDHEVMIRKRCRDAASYFF